MFLVMMFLYMALGLTLTSAGVSVEKWQYWVSFAILVSVDILSDIHGSNQR